MADDDSRTPADAGARTEPVVLDFGGAPTPPAGPPHRWSGSVTQLTQRLRATVSGLRTPPATGRTASLALAALGALAGAVSAGGVWIDFVFPEVSVDDGEPYADALLVSGLGGYGTAYLLGFLVLLIGAALALFGSAKLRRDTRIAALALGGGLLVLLVVVTSNAEGLVRSPLGAGRHLVVQTETGAGLTAALVGVGTLMLAVHLAGRADAPHDTGSGQGDAVVPTVARPAAELATGPDAELVPPADLTVAPTDPFVRPDQPPYQNRRW
ncbi:hypothetical protein [Micromonospora sp. LOL_023]|uniref:hypothetical protein n=1 Tax=Micromonospora sp. LOL_023 TaxID=3345418 RepID=UPI003A84C3A5